MAIGLGSDDTCGFINAPTDVEIVAIENGMFRLVQCQHFVGKQCIVLDRNQMIKVHTWLQEYLFNIRST